MATSRLLVLPAAIVAAAALLLGGCSQDEEAASDPAPAAANGESTVRQQVSDAGKAIEEGAVVIDVRTPQEYAAGHLEGALNIDAEAASFEDELRALDRDDSYVLYCASGNRAGVALELMQDLGFRDVINAGGFEGLAASGFKTATGS